MFSITPERMPGLLAAFAVLCLVIAVLIVGQPCMEEVMAAETEGLLAGRTLHVHPGELLSLLRNDNDDLYTIALDVRSAEEYESFHVNEAHHTSVSEIMDTLAGIEVVKGALDHLVIVVMSNDEAAATEAWYVLTDAEIPNVYILDGGVNNWLNTFAAETFKEAYAIEDKQDDEPAYLFETSLAAMAGQRLAADPDLATLEQITYDKKVNIGFGGEPSEAAAPASGGGCGG